MEKQPGLPLSTFIIRFWQELGADAPHWYGHIRHIQSGEQASFTDEATLTRFIRRWITIPREEGENHECLSLP